MRALLVCLALAACGTRAADWRELMGNYGGDDYVFPEWVLEQVRGCTCDESLACSSTYTPAANELSFCRTKEWMLRHMPKKDLYFLPPSVSVVGGSMLDDTIIFAMVADKANAYSPTIALSLKLAYIMPHSEIMNAVNNFRPTFFARYYDLVANATSTLDAVQRLVQPDVFVKVSDGYVLPFTSSTSPPSTSPYDFIANGYGSCTAWATTLVYTCRALGIPARVVGSPCWNDGDFKGLATANKNLSLCYAGGKSSLDDPGAVGGGYLWNHNWVEIWDSDAREWGFINVPSESKELNKGWMCTGFDKALGCAGGRASMASLDHPVFAYTWNLPGELDADVDGGEVVLGKDFVLTDGQRVSPLVWSPHLQDAFGNPMHHQVRMVNRTDFYRNRRTQ